MDCGFGSQHRDAVCHLRCGGKQARHRQENQQDNGSQWVSLGRYNFTVGWNQVAISRWATAGSVVVADAIKVE